MYALTRGKDGGGEVSFTVLLRIIHSKLRGIGVQVKCKNEFT